MRLALLLLALGSVVGCGGASDAAAPVATTDDPALVLGDVQYLLGEAVSAHNVEDLATAERSWGDAVERWRLHLGPRIRAQDPRVALEIEYTLGRLGDALRKRGDKAKVIHASLDKALRDLEPRLKSLTPAAAETDAQP